MYPLDRSKGGKRIMLAYTIAGLLSACILGGAIFLGYRLFNWAFATHDTFALLGMYIATCVAALILTFVNGLIGTVLTYIKGSNPFGMIVGILWVGAFIAIALYPWFKSPYTMGTIIVRIVGSCFCLASAAWALIMMGLMSTK